MTKNINKVTKGEGASGEPSGIDFDSEFMIIGGSEAEERKYKNDNSDASMKEALERSKAFRFKHNLGKAGTLAALFSVGEA